MLMYTITLQEKNFQYFPGISDYGNYYLIEYASKLLHCGISFIGGGGSYTGYCARNNGKISRFLNGTHLKYLSTHLLKEYRIFVKHKM